MRVKEQRVHLWLRTHSCTIISLAQMADLSQEDDTTSIISFSGMFSAVVINDPTINYVINKF